VLRRYSLDDILRHPEDEASIGIILCKGKKFEAQGYSSQMTMARPFSIRIFCPDGNPVGLRILSKSNWTGCGLVCPRSILPAVKSRKEFSQPGVYVLVGPPEDGELPKIYVGEGDPVGPRLESPEAALLLAEDDALDSEQ